VIRPDEPTCAETRRVIHAYAFGRLTEEDASTVRRHVSRCPHCRAIVEEIDCDTAEVLEVTGLDELPPDLIDLILIAAVASEPPVVER
jgi:anti-sigma factor ChrR (cupin superfamily)